MKYSSEREMYPGVCVWLETFLRERHRRSEVKVCDGSRKSLARLITDNGIHKRMPPEWVSWDIQVDVVGFVFQKKYTVTAFVECKNSALTLRDLSQLLGYSRIALPRYSFLISPQGPSDSLRSLLMSFNRRDVLRFDEPAGHLPRSIVVAKWHPPGESIDWGTVIADDSFRIGRL